ncbi:PLP-dependent aminotransferase family protein [Microbacterium sp. Marseille-Q6965]|uniref:aminotransferase-like domain-containing protein n=1 Tax=Microbacterium sp. Marseille-Q6965 TaxID=2965072 RepID=UPI0021B6FEC3|nr:PLP-dependent aminotransferase family protein [Microbacterium sp. Marseille-Q6965]
MTTKDSDMFTALGASSLLASLPPRQGFGDATLIRLAPGAIDLGGGNPATGLLPTELYRDASAAFFSGDDFPRALRYSPAPGLPALRAAIAEREGVEAERVLVTNGGAHGLALVALGTLDRGDVIVVDDPVYPLFLRVLDLVGASVVGVPVGADGLDVDALAARLRAGLRPKALFTVPTFHNPSGGTLSAQKADALVDLAEKYGFTIIADDPYREIAFPGTVVPRRARLRESPQVVSVGTFSKTLGPGLRLGWLVVPPALAEHYVRLRNRLDGQSSAVLQEIVTRILSDARFGPALRTAGEGYAEKAGALVEALRTEFGDDVDVDAPQGGFFAWARLRGDLDFAQLFEAAQDAGVTYQRGEWFSATGERPFRGHARLSFSEPEVHELREGVSRLAQAWRALRAR